MNQKSLSRWLKAIIIGTGLGAASIYIFVLPMYYGPLTVEGEYKTRMILLAFTAIPAFLMLRLAWKIATNIGKDQSFSLENAKFLKHIAIYALVDSVYYFIMNVYLFAVGWNQNVNILVIALIAFVGVVIAVAAACLSHLVLKAATLQEQSDFTI